LLGPSSIHTEERDQSRTQQYPTVAKSVHPHIAEISEERPNFGWKLIVVIRISFEPQVEQRLRNMSDWMIDGLGNRLINRFTIAGHASVCFKWQSQDAAAQIQQNFLVLINRLRNGVDPRRYAVSDLLHDVLGHGLHQLRGGLPGPQHHSLFAPCLQCLAPSVGWPYTVLCQIA